MTNKTTTRSRARKPTDSYFSLVRQFPLRRIRGEAEYAQGRRVVRELMIRGDDNLDDGEVDYLRVLAQLIWEYEHEEIVRKRNSPLQTLKHLMESRGMRVGDLAKVIGSASAASMVLRGQREMSKAHIRKLAGHFGVRADLFL